MIRLYSILFLILTISGSSISVAYKNTFIVSFTLLIFFLLTYKRKLIFKKLKYFVITLFPVAFFWAVHGFTNELSYLRFFLLIYIALLFYINYNLYAACEHFVKLIHFLAIVSMIHWGTALIFPINDFFPTITNFERNISYYFTGISGLLVHAPHRNCSIFWEPGIFATYLVIALVLNTKTLNNKVFGYKNITLIVTLFSTFSTFGVTMVILSIFFLLLDKSTSSFKNKFYRYLTNLSVIYVFTFLLLNYKNIILYLIELSPKVFYKLNTDASISATTRFVSPIFDFKIFLKSPIYGVGISEYFQTWGDFLYNTKELIDSSTSTLTYYLATFGIIFFVFFFFFLKKLLSIKKLNGLFLIFLIFLIISILSKEPHQNFQFWYVSLAYIFFNKNE